MNKNLLLDAIDYPENDTLWSEVSDHLRDLQLDELVKIIEEWREFRNNRNFALDYLNIYD